MSRLISLIVLALFCSTICLSQTYELKPIENIGSDYFIFTERYQYRTEGVLWGAKETVLLDIGMCANKENGLVYLIISSMTGRWLPYFGLSAKDGDKVKIGITFSKKKEVLYDAFCLKEGMVIPLSKADDVSLFRRYDIIKICEIDGRELSTFNYHSASTIDIMCKKLIEKIGDHGQFGNAPTNKYPKSSIVIDGVRYFYKNGVYQVGDGVTKGSGYKYNNIFLWIKEFVPAIDNGTNRDIRVSKIAPYAFDNFCYDGPIYIDVATICHNAFNYSCIKTISFGPSVKMIEANAFAGCTKVIRICFQSRQPPKWINYANSFGINQLKKIEVVGVEKRIIQTYKRLFPKWSSNLIEWIWVDPNGKG